MKPFFSPVVNEYLVLLAECRNFTADVLLVPGWCPLSPLVRPRQKPTRSRRSLLNIRNTAPIAIRSLIVLSCVCLRLRHVRDATAIAIGGLIVAVTVVAAFILLVHVGDAAASAGGCVLVGLRALHGNCYRGHVG